MARLLSKLHGCVVVTGLAILFFLYRYRSAGSGYVLQTSWHGTAHRIVVFGDDWSDTGKHRVSPSFFTRSHDAARDIDRGLLWTETLCEKLGCNIIANFAQSLPVKSNNMEHGPLVDSDIHRDARNRRSTGEVLPDFKTQVQQFLDYEKERPRNTEKLDEDDCEWTVFTVYFGLWDLLEYAKLEKETAMLAIDNSISTLFRNLDLLATQVPAMKVVLPLMVDMTFLPRFQATKRKLQDDFAESQHLMVFLWAYWNAVLSRVAKQWNNGEIVMPNPNSILMQQVTTRQLFSEGSAGSSLDGGQQSPMFDNVVQPCLTVRSENDSPDLQAAGVQKCADPLAHLFWDDIRLGGIAHQLIGEATASLMRRNQTVNMGTTSQGPVSDDGLGTQEGESFNLKFPPGY